MDVDGAQPAIKNGLAGNDTQFLRVNFPDFLWITFSLVQRFEIKANGY
jgi:hypothetical protein